jgi:hypothetical protein
MRNREKSVTPARNKTPTVQPVARCYTKWALPASSCGTCRNLFLHLPFITLSCSVQCYSVLKAVIVLHINCAHHVLLVVVKCFMRIELFKKYMFTECGNPLQGHNTCRKNPRNILPEMIQKVSTRCVTNVERFVYYSLNLIIFCQSKRIIPRQNWQWQWNKHM